MTHEVYHQKELQFTGSADDCWIYIHKHQSMSVHWAEKYGEWEIKKKMNLPKINHDLFDVPLSQLEKIAYMKARSLISACLHAESGSVVFEKEKAAIDTINKLNKKMKFGE